MMPSIEYFKQLLDSMMSSRESFKEDTVKTNSLDFSENDTTEKSVNRDIGQLRQAETYLKLSKKSVYYEKCLDIFNDIFKCANDQRKDPGNLVNDDHINVLSSPAYAEYRLNNWCGLLPFWT